MTGIKQYNHSILRKKCLPVRVLQSKTWTNKETEKNTEEIEDLVKKMIEVVKENRGIGLAACQIGLLKRIIVVQTEKGYQEFINPEILWQSREKEIMEEGCLSFPRMFLKIKRPKEIEIKAFTKQREDIHIKVKGFLARIFQHEIDHLNGVLFIDHLNIFQQWRIKKKLKKLYGSN